MFTISEIQFKNKNIKFPDNFGINILFFQDTLLHLTSFVIITNDMEHIICIDGFDKVYDFFTGFELTKFNSVDTINKPEIFILPSLKITKGKCQSDSLYFYLQPHRILFVFDSNPKIWMLLIKKLKPKLICFNTGKIFTQVEAFIECLV